MLADKFVLMTCALTLLNAGGHPDDGTWQRVQLCYHYKGAVTQWHTICRRLLRHTLRCACSAAICPRTNIVHAV